MTRAVVGSTGPGLRPTRWSASSGRSTASRSTSGVAPGSSLPIGDCSVDLVTAIWLLHLLSADAADQLLAEAARVLRPGGHLVTTVDKLRRTTGDH